MAVEAVCCELVSELHVYQGKYRENTGKIQGKYRENTGKIQGKYREFFGISANVANAKLKRPSIPRFLREFP